MNAKALNIHIPALNVHYWTLMILATTTGEIVGNLLSRNLNLGYSTGSILLISTYAIAITTIFLIRKESASIYWLLIVLGNIAGTNCADFVTIQPLQLGTIWGSLLVMGILATILLVWRAVAPRTSVDGALNGKTFVLYWLAILMSSTFGTTSGDLLSNDTPLGAGGGTLLLLGVLSIFLALHAYTKTSKDLLYWLALVFVHPIGATIGNYISKPAGLDLGNVWTSIVLIAMFVLLFVIRKQRTLRSS